jgi:uncharacterized OB-fold protein
MEHRAFTGTSFYQFLGESKLMGSRCQSCGALHVPPRAMCPACFGEEMAWEEMHGDGELVAFTTVHIAPTAMLEAGYDRKNPYCAGIVQLAEGPAISAQILGVEASRPEEIEVGMPVRVAFVRRGEGEAQRTFLAFERI